MTSDLGWFMDMRSIYFPAQNCTVEITVDYTEDRADSPL